jgi:hypothetical protein
MPARPVRRDVTKDLAKLRELLNAWDPYSLIRFGTPENEFDPERDEIYGALTSGTVQSQQALAGRIAAIFQKWFDDSYTVQNCSDIARQIWNWWRDT